MSTSFWQINPALLIEDNVEERKLQFGQMPAFSFDISDEYDSVRSILYELKEKEKFCISEFQDIVQKFFLASEDLFDDLVKLKVLIKYISHSNRYSRHHYYYSLNGLLTDSQQRLSSKSVMLIGAGGIGSTCALLLAAAGIGKLILADDDVLEESNLTRTILFNSSDVGNTKVESAREHLFQKNPSVCVEILDKKLSYKNLILFEEKAKNSNFIILSGDSGPEVHALAYRLSEKYSVPLMNAGYVETYGVVGPTTVGKNLRRELESYLDKSFVNRPSAASYGPLNSLISSMAVNEVIRHLLDLQIESLNTRLIINSEKYDIEKEEWQ